jgi:hypothetical protein
VAASDADSDAESAADSEAGASEVVDSKRVEASSKTNMVRMIPLMRANGKPEVYSCRPGDRIDMEVLV